MVTVNGVQERSAGTGGGVSCGSCLSRVTHLQVSVHHAHLVTVQHSLQDLLDTVTGERGGRVRPLGKLTAG